MLLRISVVVLFVLGWEEVIIIMVVLVVVVGGTRTTALLLLRWRRGANRSSCAISSVLPVSAVVGVLLPQLWSWVGSVGGCDGHDEVARGWKC